MAAREQSIRASRRQRLTLPDKLSLGEPNSLRGGQRFWTATPGPFLENCGLTSNRRFGCVSLLILFFRAVEASAVSGSAAAAARSSGTTMANKGIGAAPCVAGAQHGSGNRTEHVVTQMTRYAVSYWGRGGIKCGLVVKY